MRFLHVTPALGSALALSVLAAAGVTTTGAAAAAHLPNAVRSRIALPAKTATYSLRDIGAPPTSSYRVFYTPVGFNKTGQIVGDGYLAANPGYGYQQCIAWSGTTWINLSGAPSLDCYVSSGVSDANSSGAFGAVGEVEVPTNDQFVAFYAHGSPKSATMTAFSANAPSQLYAMNASGLAAGFTQDTPVGGYDYSQPVAISTGSSIGLLQPTCVTAVAGCVEYPVAYTFPQGQSRSITAGGTVLAYAANMKTGEFVEYTGGTKPTFAQFSIPLDDGYGAGELVGMDDKGDVPYQEFDTKSDKYLVWMYSPSTKKARSLGTLPGNSCNSYNLQYVNGPGRVLGYTTGCSSASDATYWTWDATNGIVALTFNHTAYSAATPELINDLGQIAVDLTTTSNVHHWGILMPPAKL